MPYKSQAQRKAMNAMALRGEIDKAVVAEFNAKSRGKKLPFKVKKKKRKARA